MKKKLFLITALSISLLLALFTVLLFAVNAEIRFLTSEKISSLFRSADVLIVSPEYDGYTLEELKDLENVSFDHSLMLVNEQYLLEDGFTPGIVSYNGAEMTQETLEAYQTLSSYLKTAYKKPLYVRSSYRTEEEQKEIYENSAENVAAIVGASEHQTGLALDIYVEGFSGNALLKCAAGRYVNKECYRYGFIIRYPNGKSDITGIVFEPWHIRYVGKAHAEIMYLESLTLEEYVTEYLIPGEFYYTNNTYISRQAPDEGGRLFIPSGVDSVSISPDNTGHYIITAHCG